MKLWRSKTKHFCKTSFKNDALKLKNEAFVRDFLQKWSFEDQKRSISARLPSKMTRRPCACHEKVEPRHTKSCNCHAKWSLQSNTSVTWNLQPFHGFCVGGFKHRHRKARNPCPCHAKRIVSEPLQIHHACQRFCNPHELLRLPRTYFAMCRNPCACHAKQSLKVKKRPEHPVFLGFWLPNRSRAQAWCEFWWLQLPKVLRRCQFLTILTSESLSRASVVQILVTSTSKSAPRLSVFDDFDFRIALARRRGANFGDFNFQKCSEPLSF